MRHIEKAAEPVEFTQWKVGEEESWNPGWEDFDTRPIKQAVKEALLVEQGYLCCYCEKRIDEREGEEKGHIEHLKPRHAHPELDLAYGNLMFSCSGDNGRPPTCGHAKGGQFLPVSPLNHDCESRFLYTRMGEMRPYDEDDMAASNTIRILNLNSSRLCRERARVYKVIEEGRQGLSAEEFSEWIEIELSRDEHNRLTPFWTTKRYVAERTA
jgi:uncharacterized protein (TIGR02646 family)